MTERTCQNCIHAGYDPDGPYCANPVVLKKHSWGLALSSLGIVEYCPAPAHPLFEVKKNSVPSP